MKSPKCFIQLFSIIFLVLILIQPVFAQEQIPSGQSKSNSAKPETAKSDPVPVGQSKSSPAPKDDIGGDIFGEKGGRFHPFLILQEVWTDNLYATNTGTKDDFITTASPGIWVAFPANREKLLQLSTTTTAPGGLKLSRFNPETSRRIQTYFLYSPEFVLYADNSHHDHTNHRAEAMFQLNTDSGLSFNLIDLFNDKEEIAGNGVANTLYSHQDNLIDFTTTYITRSDKLKIKLNYSNYQLEYDDTAVTYRDRTDNSFGAAIFYKFWPKTSLFLEYNHSDIDFDNGITNDSTEQRYYAGATWDITAKTQGSIKLGFIDKDFDLASVADQDGFSVEVQTQVNLTPKRAFQVNAYRKFHESDLATASSYLSSGVEFALLQRFSEKWSGTLNAFYEVNEYNGIVRDDDYYGIGPAIRFEPKKWLTFDLGFMHYNNDSNDQTYDYETNQVFLRGTLAL